MPAIRIHGYAIVSDDDRIADGSGETPALLRNDADWNYFQNQLDRAALVALGRLGHEANVNTKQRPRLIVSSSSSGLDRRKDGWWWNPAKAPWDEIGRIVLPEGGRVAVPGGRRVFDLFLAIGYDTFHLSRAEGVVIGEGVGLFTACEAGIPAERVLSAAGLRAGPRTLLDPKAPVSLTLWRAETETARRIER